MGSPRAGTGKETKKFPYGQSPFLKRVCDHMGSNMYAAVHNIFLDDLPPDIPGVTTTIDKIEINDWLEHTQVYKDP
jgi:hypothetical protein